MKVINKTNNFLKRAKEVINPVSISEFAKYDVAIEKALGLIRYYYFLLLYMAYELTFNPIQMRQNYEPFWPLSWSTAMDLNLDETVMLVKFFFIACCLLGAMAYKSRAARILVFVAIWQVHALESSFQYINHQWYNLLYTSFIFIFLPDLTRQRLTEFTVRYKLLLTIWTAQAFVMATYSMAGFNKWKAVVEQIIAGHEVHGLSMMAFAYQGTDFVRQLQVEALLLPYIVEHPAWFWPLYVGFYFVQISALWVMVRTSLQKTWALIFGAFHIATILSMGIGFGSFVFVLLIMFANSPFVHNVTFRKWCFDLPVIGQIAEFIVRKRKKTNLVT